MAVFDLQTFIQERLRAFDESMDVTSGSPADVQLIQPMLRRLGVDPFTVDMVTFLSDRLRQAFPEMATDEGDALTDLLVKPALLLWDPIVREIYRIRACQSWKDSSILTTDEAEALGANLFVERDRGDFARGVGRVYYAQPRAVSATPVNFFTSKGGLHFYPDGQQDITVQEMMLNTHMGMYYFDVTLIAEAAGVAYNIDANELSTVANLEGTMKVNNLRRFRSGDNDETSVEYVDRAAQGLTERSMVTIRGIGARIPKAFPEVTRLGVVGCGDPEMQRDVLTGGGLGDVLVGGLLGQTVLDQESRSVTRRLRVLDAGVDFLSTLDKFSLESYVVTVAGCFSTSPPVRDLRVKRIVDGQTLDMVEQVFIPSYLNLTWTVRKRELTLSGVPGGLLYPDGQFGTVAIPDGEVHVGGMYDVSVRGSSFDTSSLVLENVTDAAPAARGVACEFTTTNTCTLLDLVLGDTYLVDDAVYTALANAKEYGFVLQVLTGVNAGNYRVLDVVQGNGAPPIVTLDDTVTVLVGSFRWQLVDEIDIDLVEPKAVRVSGDDMQSVQNSDVLYTASSTDLAGLGVSERDIVRISSGAVAADYEVKALVAFNAVRVDRTLSTTATDLKYTIYRMNSGGGATLPLVRVTKVELLDSSGQPVGTTVPYAKPIDVQSRSFENPGRGTKVDITDARLGILTIKEPVGGFVVGGQSLIISNLAIAPLAVTFTGGNKTRAQLISELNAAAASLYGIGTVVAKELFDGDAYRVGIVPLSRLTVCATGSAMAGLFASTLARSSVDVRSQSVEDAGGWAAVTPAIDQDDLDVLQVLEGNQVGFYGSLGYGSTSADSLLAGDYAAVTEYPAFVPEVGVRVQIGARSLGSARCYFMDPTSIEFKRSTRFKALLSDGTMLNYFPDPTLDFVKLPAYPTTSLVKDGVIAGAGTPIFASSSQDFVLSSVIVDDHLVLRYVPIVGTTVLGTSVAVANMHITLALEGNADQIITFEHDSESIPVGSVTTAGMVAQINSAVGKTIAKIGSGNHFELESDVVMLVRGTSVGSANAVLGLPAIDQYNNAYHQGIYVVKSVTQHQLEATPLPGSVAHSLTSHAESRVSFEVRRPGAQRVSSTEMSGQTAEAGLYYCDVQLVSEGTGDLYNIPNGTQLQVEGYRSDGYYLTTADPNLTFSTVERPTLHVSRSIQEIGVADDPSNATQLTGQNLEITYDRAGLVADVQNFASSETERVVCSNPLARHLVPHFVRFDLVYTGGSSADVVAADIRQYVADLFPQDYLEVGDLNSLAYRRGATGVTNPISMIAVVYNYDRTVWAQRSQDALGTGRLSAFVVDVVNVNRKSG